jgi:hypothetical protein
MSRETGRERGGVDRDEKNVSNLRSIRSVPAQNHHRVGAKENGKEREKKQRCEVVAWLLCGLRFERASFPPISSHEKGPEGERRDASKR